jgi:predicted amidohydrolase
MRVAVVQHDIAWEQRDANFAHLAPTVAQAAAGGARLVVLTEMFATGFSMASDRIAEPVDGPSAHFLREQAQRNDVWMCASIATRSDASRKPTNRLVLVAPDGTTHHYDKIHPFSYGGEHERYDAGSTFLTVLVEGVRTSFFVCYDLRFADEFWAVAPATDCYIVVANWPEARRAHWRSLLVARAIENQAYVIGANRVGDGKGIAYSGDSMIVDPLGEVLVTASRTETVCSAVIDAAVVEKVRAEFPFLRDRR